jgi:3-hydroxyacyl-CoA dehydrogenase
MKAEGLAPAAWVNDMLASETQVLFSKRRSNVFYNIPSKLCKQSSGQDAFIILNNIREKQKYGDNSGAKI